MVFVFYGILFYLGMVLQRRFLSGTYLRKVAEDSQKLVHVVESFFFIIPPLRHVGLLKEGGLWFRVQPERWYHRWLKQLGLATEITISDADFDKKFFLSLDHRFALDSTNVNDEFIALLKELFALPVASLHATPQRIWCVIKPIDATKHDGYFEKHYDLLARIAKASEALAKDIQPAAESEGTRVAAFAFIGGHAGLLTSGILGAASSYFDSIDILDLSEWLIRGFLVALVLTPLWLAAVMRFLRGSSWISWVLMDFVICGMLGIYASSLVVTREINTHYQQSTEMHTATVMQKSCTLKCKGRPRKTRSHSLETDAECRPESRQYFLDEKKQQSRSCRKKAYYSYEVKITPFGQTGAYDFAVEEPLFDTLSLGAKVRVPVHQGSLGVEWVDTEEIQPQED
jgi:hypothetical protein